MSISNLDAAPWLPNLRNTRPGIWLFLNLAFSSTAHLAVGENLDFQLPSRPLVTLFAVVERQEHGAMRTKNESSRPQSEKLWRKRANLDMSDM